MTDRRGVGRDADRESAARRRDRSDGGGIMFDFIAWVATVFGLIYILFMGGLVQTA
ncbi:MAG: hypothetical protein KJ057_10360 [Phycisphaerae bacterium]|nr:hypothetical protein [Planctomycetia bacterium]MCK6464524.1 hypothetical protein [Phycisphaerae bacterium]MCL4718861.1 hypothetical protein [Phycisphaerae bacterium]NUQ09901.1 hypothetical protein [Phycisphaerae bacterium]